MVLRKIFLPKNFFAKKSKRIELLVVYKKLFIIEPNPIYNLPIIPHDILAPLFPVFLDSSFGPLPKSSTFS